MSKPAATEQAIERFVDDAIERIGGGPDRVVALLHAVQDEYHYLPEPALKRLAEHTEIHPADLLGVSTFYDRFRHRPAGAHAVRVCHGTACHVRGSERLEEALRRDLHIPEGDDTDPDRRFTLEGVACVGCCSLAPVVQVDDATLGHADGRRVSAEVMRAAADQADHRWRDEAADGNNGAAAGEVRIALDSCCLVSGAAELHRALLQAVRRLRLRTRIRRVGCMGLCRSGPSLQIVEPSGRETTYAAVEPGDVEALLSRHFRPRALHAVGRWSAAALDWLVGGEVHDPTALRRLDRTDPERDAAESHQVRIATEHYGQLDPLDLYAYRAADGFAAWRQVVDAADPDQVIKTITDSGLRGRGGGGFATGRKWALARQQPGEKIVICNGDEGDPGAFMDRMLMESFPFRVIEGLAIAAQAIGAAEGLFYIRHEYPLALRRIRRAIELCEAAGLLGDGAMDGRASLRLSVCEGAGAFVCGEETAMIASIEGRRGTPSIRPPYPIEQGLQGRPTLVNNVETLANVPWILRRGAEAFAAYGGGESRGTKVFALAGKVRRGGLVEAPMGSTIRQVVEEIGGGIPGDRAFKAVQIGGPSGGCLPASLADTPIDYEALRDAGAIMGSGGLIVLDDTDCMVDLARYFLQFTQAQSCGKCSFCRVGTRRMHEILIRLCRGDGRAKDLDNLEALAPQVAAGSLCGLGATAPNPVLTALRYFREEFEAHVQGRCPAGRCPDLVHYRVLNTCVGCTLCAQACPVDAIPMTPYRIHTIDDQLCTRCDACREVCPHDAIEVS
jgi:NADH-quinone oxidoreductase subunit F